MQRVETYILRKTKCEKEYLALVDICHKSKNLYNYVNYVLRQCQSNKLENIPEFVDLIKSEKKIVKSKKTNKEKEYTQNFISEFDISKRLAQTKQFDYTQLKAQVSQQTISLLFKNYKSFYKSVSDYYRNPSKYKGRPKMPSYKEKDGLNIAVFTNQCSTIDKDGHIKLSKELTLKTITTSISKKNFKQIRIIPKLDYFQIEIVYEKTEGDYVRQAKEQNKKTNIAAIDLGVDNIATITSDDSNINPIIINGRALKSTNHYFNKQLANIKNEYSKHNIHTGRKLQKLNSKRCFKINDYFHKASRRIVDFCINHNIGTLYIGLNKGWKQESNMSRQNNQNFVQIPFNNLIQMIQYKCEEVGINVVCVNEAYTSKCSFLDNESIEKHDSYLGKRTKRGLFISSDKKKLNADVNGSLNILRKSSNKNIKVSTKIFNPIKIKDINAICDVVYFKWQPTNTGCVFQPNNIDIK
jgi:IS605 OrfB family transposase